MTDELERRLRAADPVPPTVPVDVARSPRAQTLVERIMSDTPASLDPAARPRRWPLLVLTAAAAVVAVLAGVTAFAGDDDEPVATEALSLTVAAEDLTQMCIEVTPETMRDSGIELAFEGTVTAVEGDQATLTVDEWYLGGDADQVTVTGPEGSVALLGSVTLEEGSAYLISASDGVVRSCGQSGPVSAELETIFAEAFGG